jgi:hypothetical protein
MPMLIDHIDAISRKRKRDVLFVDFPLKDTEDSFDDFDVNWDAWPPRQQTIAWLNQNQIAWWPCAHFADENTMIGYQGLIYIDVPFDITDLVYQRLQNYLETPDGAMRFPGVRFCYLPLEMAMKNAHHDEPGFWERWAKNF